MTLEAASNEFLDPQVGPDAINTLLEMGWSPPTKEDGLPNFTVFLEPDRIFPGAVARFLITTLRDAYLVTPQDRFELAPQELFIDIATGAFGNALSITFSPIDLLGRTRPPDT